MGFTPNIKLSELGFLGLEGFMGFTPNIKLSELGFLRLKGLVGFTPNIKLSEVGLYGDWHRLMLSHNRLRLTRVGICPILKVNVIFFVDK